MWSEEEEAEAEAEVEVGKRLALTNMDWDNLTAVDVLSIFSSMCKGGDMVVSKVEIYPSLYGIEQMKKDTLYGPPKEVFVEEEEGEAEKRKKKKRKSAAANGEEDVFADDQNVFDQD